MRRGAPASLVALSVALAVLVHASTASAFWSGRGDASRGVGAAAATSIAGGSTPTASSRGSASLRVRWGASQTDGGRTATGYLVGRRDSATGTRTPATGGCAGVVTTTTCLETGLAVGTWSYDVTPVLGTNWRGATGPASGEVSTGSALVRMARPILGAPLPTEVSGTLTGFVPGEAISYLVDGVPAPGASPATAGSTGGASFVMDLPPGLADGPHTVRLVGNDAIAPSAATASVLVDTTPPVITGVASPPPNAAGWNNTTVRVGGSASDGDGSGYAGTYVTVDGSDPTTSPTAALVTAELELTSTTTVRSYSVDLAGNRSAVEEATYRIDRTPPGMSLSAVEVTGGVWADVANATVFYRGAEAGSFRLLAAVLDPGGSGAASLSTPEHAASSIGFAHVAGTFTTPVGGPYLDNAVSWVAGTTSSPVPIVSVADVAGNVTTINGRIVPDDVAPSGGSLQVSGTPIAPGGYATSTTLRVSMTDAVDTGSGLRAGGRTLLRATAPLTADNGRVECGSYGAYVDVGGGSGPTFDDTVAPGGACYRYRLEVLDNVGNVGRFESNELRVQTSADAALAPSVVGIAAAGGSRSQWVSGTAIYYNPGAAGSFVVDVAARDSVSGVTQVAFPTLAAFTGGGAVTEPTSPGTWRMAYAWTAGGAGSGPGTQAVSATNGAGLTATSSAAFSVLADAAGPTGAAVAVAGLGGTGSRYLASRTVTISVAPGTDAGSGVDASAARLERASAALLSDGTSNGACGAFGGYAPVATAPTTAVTDLVPTDGTCYRYRYTTTDRVGNASEVTSTDVKVDTTPPSLTLGASAGAASAWSSAASTVYYRPGAAGGSFTIAADATDPASGVATFGFPTLPTGWSASSPTTGSRTYSWTAAQPTAPSGPQAVTATNHAGLTSTAGFTVTPDAAAPGAGTITYATGWRATGNVPIGFAAGADGGSGLDLASGRVLRRTAPIVAGACGTFGARQEVTTTTTASGTVVDASVVTDTCYRYEFDVADRVGNLATATSPNTVMVDLVAPTQLLSLTSPVGASMRGDTVYFRGGVAGSFGIVDATTDAAGASSVTFPTAAATGFTHNAETVATSTAGVFTSASFAFTSTAVAPTARTVTVVDPAGNVGSSVVNFVRDATAPTGGSIGYPNAVVSELQVPLTLTAGSDVGAGMAAGGGVVQRASATYTPSSKTCGTFGAFTTVTIASSVDTAVVSGTCYRYQLVASDAVGNTATWSSASVVRVDMSGPRVTAIVSQQANGTAGNGRLEVGDKLILSINEDISTAGTLASYPGTLDSVGGGNVVLTIPGITAGARNTGSTAYLATPGTTASFVLTPTLVNGGANTKLTLAVASIGGAAPAVGIGALSWLTDPAITNTAGSPANTVFTTAATFRLF
ncbi:MAG: laminin sub domain 2 [Thermoleophilia bacterium]|nr:laminin sub domain 2 [Thermoleophilia bacterium]